MRKEKGRPLRKEIEKLKPNFRKGKETHQNALRARVKGFQKKEGGQAGFWLRKRERRGKTFNGGGTAGDRVGGKNTSE